MNHESFSATLIKTTKYSYSNNQLIEKHMHVTNHHKNVENFLFHRKFELSIRIMTAGHTHMNMMNRKPGATQVEPTWLRYCTCLKSHV